MVTSPPLLRPSLEFFFRSVIPQSKDEEKEKEENTDSQRVTTE